MEPQDQSRLAVARRRLEDVKMLSLAGSLLAFGGLTATMAVEGASQAVRAATGVATVQSSAAPVDTSTTAPAPTAAEPQAPVAAAPAPAPAAPPAPVRPPIVSAQS